MATILMPDLPHHPDRRRGIIGPRRHFQMAFTPKFSLNLQSASPNAFAQVLEDFEAWRQTQPPRDLDLSNGWKVITQEHAEGMLLRNPVGANRRPTLPTVKYYARQMADNGWKKTGQAILFDTDGKLLDAGHRLWAAYLSGASFPSYVIGDVPADPTLFAFIDNCKARSPADALATAGLNGLAKQMATVVSMAMHFDHGCYSASTKKTLDKISPIEVVSYVQQNDNLRQAVRLMAGEYKAAAKVLLYKDVGSFTAFKIIELHGEETLEDFMTELGHVSDEHEEGSPIAALQKVMADDENSREPMLKHQVLGHVIKGFNAWVNDEHVKKISLKVNETFPRFALPAPEQQAAE
jgi:hypothetical protein